jgi:hypothetical protein
MLHLRKPLRCACSTGVQRRFSARLRKHDGSAVKTFSRATARCSAPSKVGGYR